MRSAPAIIVTAAALLVGCALGATEADEPSATSEEASTAAPVVEQTEAPAETEQPATEPPATEEEPAEAETVAVPEGGPENVAEFPVPAGAQITDLGAGLSSWQFVVMTSDPDEVIAFYETTLADAGYTIESDVMADGVDLQFDLAFSGETFGTLRTSPLLGGVEVQLAEERFWV